MSCRYAISAAVLAWAICAAPAAADVLDAAQAAAPASPLVSSEDLATTVEEVVVTASRNRESPRVVSDSRTRLTRTPGAVSVVANETYEDRAAQGLSDLLRDVPGVIADRRYGEESRLSIRGSGIGQGYHQRGVLLAQDGVPFADADGFSDFQGIDALNARYIDVYRGGNALRFGGAQLGGAANLVTPTGRTAQSEYLLRLEGGSFGLLRGQASAAKRAGDFDGYFNIDGLTADGWRDHSAQAQVRATANLGWGSDEDHAVRLVLYGADIGQEVPGTLTLDQALHSPRVAPAVNVANDYRRDQTLARASLQGRWRFSEQVVVEGGVYVTGKQLFHPIYQVLDQDSSTHGAFARLDWTGALGGHRADLYAGFSWRQGELDALQFANVGGRRGAMTSDGVQQAEGRDLFAEGRLFITDQLAVVAGGSWGWAARDYRRFAVPGNLALPFADSREFDWFAPRFGLLWQADEAGPQIYANITRSVEPPTFGALVQGAQPSLVPVRAQEAWTGEVGARGRSGDFTWDLSIYRAELDGEMLNFLVGPDIPAGTFNAGRTIHQGIEAALDWRIPVDLPGGAKLMLRQTYTYGDFRFDADPTWGDNRLPVAPRHDYRATLRWSSPDGWFVAPSVQWRPDEAFVDYANTMKAPGFAVWSLNGGWELDNGISLFVDLRNLTDERYVAEFAAITDARLPGVSKAVFYPGEGRSLFVGARRRF
jgi:iron complex outermembrane receptor protein